MRLGGGRVEGGGRVKMSGTNFCGGGGRGVFFPARWRGTCGLKLRLVGLTGGRVVLQNMSKPGSRGMAVLGAGANSNAGVGGAAVEGSGV